MMGAGSRAFLGHLTQRTTNPIVFQRRGDEKMKPNFKVLLAALAGLAIGVLGTAAIYAQTKTPLGYLIADVDVSDQAGFQTYAAGVPATLAPFGGHYIVRGGKTIVLEGDAPHRVVVTEFPSIENAQAWYNSPAYSAIRPIRQKASKSRLFLIEGATP
jgi:uncharacterized protein (DUF1330 family)